MKKKLKVIIPIAIATCAVMYIGYMKFLFKPLDINIGIRGISDKKTTALLQQYLPQLIRIENRDMAIAEIPKLKFGMSSEEVSRLLPQYTIIDAVEYVNGGKWKNGSGQDRYKYPQKYQNEVVTVFIKNKLHGARIWTANMQLYGHEREQYLFNKFLLYNDGMVIFEQTPEDEKNITPYYFSWDHFKEQVRINLSFLIPLFSAAKKYIDSYLPYGILPKGYDSYYADSNKIIKFRGSLWNTTTNTLNILHLRLELFRITSPATPKWFESFYNSNFYYHKEYLDRLMGPGANNIFDISAHIAARSVFGDDIVALNLTHLDTEKLTETLEETIKHPKTSNLDKDYKDDNISTLHSVKIGVRYGDFIITHSSQHTYIDIDPEIFIIHKDILSNPEYLK